MGRAFNPNIFRVDYPDGRCPVVLKTFAGKHPLVRLTVGRLVTRREHRMLGKLQDIPGICRLAHPDRSHGLILEWIEGKRLNSVKEGALPGEFFQELDRTVEAMHKHGVAHLDLAHRGNIIVASDSTPVIMDFQAAVTLKYFPGFLRTVLILTDKTAILKWKRRIRPDLLTDGERQAIEKRRWLTWLWPFHHWIYWPGSRKPKQKE